MNTNQFSCAVLVRTARSLLFVPGDRPGRFDQAAAAGADAVILDLEDAVSSERKEIARTEVASWLDRGDYACVRVNAVGGPEHQRDLDALRALPGLLAVMVPKPDDPARLAAIAEHVRMPMIALVETATSLLRATELAAVPGVERLAFGHLDYAADIGATPTQTAMRHARSTLVAVSRAAGVAGPIDGVTTAIDDLGGLSKDVACARELGMTGKLLVHPRQVVGTHNGFRPTDDEIRWARSVTDATTTGDEALSVDGQMVDAPVLARAAALLHQAE
ncbi:MULTISPECIES: HpcH/HpaI aldolase/citrate lyase family protein [Prauserella salsuginis group]|uniref:HpcH/HpaI aldolase/citrate lyase family protein n=1 Tax=Prauserella salsuginis TaxID=387889 RepID=A0ABW6G0U0_9PSEU|nr:MULTISPECIES: CoA ester lyase [Prauserella salsuginis group]MCR3721978.1 citrate lyase subunit beta / citryl-CoA lyase [Prauserella flava]MCR3735984.1 citrate lyase subunit beta / citryl-CoA lyase [Prauserella salsuginis]